MANNTTSSNKFSNDQHQQQEDSDSFNRFEFTLGRLKNVETRKNLVHHWTNSKLNFNTNHNNHNSNSFSQTTISNNLMFGLNFELNTGLHSNVAVNSSQLNFNLKNSDLGNSHNNTNNNHNLFNEQTTANNLNKNNSFNECNNNQINLVNGQKLLNLTNELNSDVEHVCQQQQATPTQTQASSNDKSSNLILESTNNYSSFNRKQIDLINNPSSTCNQNDPILNGTENSNNNLPVINCSPNTSTNVSSMLNNGTNLSTYNCINSFPSLIKRDKTSNFEYQLHPYCNVQNLNYTNNMMNFGVNSGNLNQLQLPSHHMLANSISNGNMNILNNCFNGNSITPNLINNYENFNNYNNLTGYNLNNLNNLNSTLSSSINSNSSNTNFSNSCQLSNTICSVDNMITNRNLIISNNLNNQISPIDMQDQERIKLERKRLRNRIAASKCRQRKLERISKLEESNNLLKIDVENLNKLLNKTKNQNTLLKDQILEHINSGCNINKDLLSN